MKYTVSVFCLLALFWLGNSGHYSPLLLGFGVFSVIFVVWVSHRMNVIDHESQPLHFLGRKLPGYYCWLVVKIIQSNLDVVSRVWRGNSAISPAEATLPMNLETPMGKVIYANSITLTPGTVAMDLGDDTVLVHALTESGVEELRGGEMLRRVSSLERS
jgi:multicomponent Na+:H+ antiporter subunit E